MMKECCDALDPGMNWINFVPLSALRQAVDQLTVSRVSSATLASNREEEEEEEKKRRKKRLAS